MATHDDTQSAARGRMLEYAEFVEDQVARACARIKNNDMFRATLWLVTVGLAVLFLEIVLDHTVELPLVARRSVLYGGLVAGAIYAGLRIVRPMFMRVNDLYAAKSIESVDPHFKNSLINYLRLREDADKIPPSVLKSIEARAVNDLTSVNVDDVVDPSPVTQLSYALAAIVVGLCLYSWITPKNIWDSARRAFLADVARPTNTRFANVSPGEDPDAPKVVTGLPVNFSVETLGAQPDTVTLFTSRDGGKSFAETPMAKGRSFADPWTVTVEKAPGEMLYYMAGGDGRTRTYEMKAMPVALVESVTLDYDFPAYAKAPRREGVTDGNVEALQGTRVTVTAMTNQPARSGLLDFGPRPPVALAPLPGEPRKLKGTFVVEANGQYSVRFNTVDGQTNPEPVLYDIRVVKDVPPTARFIRPETPTQRPANARVPLVIEATDDFGITSAQLHVYKGGEILQQAVELVDPKSKEALKQIQTTIALDLKPLSLRDGDRIQYWLTLKDNCELQTNRFETAKQEIVIQPPVTEPERDQLARNEMAQAKEELGQQEPQPEDQPGQQGQNSQTGEGQKGQENQGENQSKDQRRSGDEQKKNDQGKQGQGKSGQGNESESAAPGDNAKSGGPQGKGQQSPSDGSATGKNDQGKGQSGQGGENSKDSQKPKGKSGERNQGQGGENPETKSERGENAPKDASKQESQNSERSGEQEKKGQQGRNGEREQGKSPTGERPPGGEETGKAEPGRKPDATERSTEKSGERPQGEQEKSNRPEPGEQSKGQQGERSGQEKEKSAEKSKSGERKDGQPGANEKSEPGEKGEPNGLPKGEPEKGEPNENARQRSLDELTQQDREKLDRLRKALGMDNQPKPQDGQPGQGEENPAGEQAKSDDQRKGEPSKSGDQEKGEAGKETGEEKGERSKSGGQEKGEAGQEKGEQSKSGGQEKGEAGLEKGEQSKSGGQEKGEQSKTGGQEKGEAGQEKGEQSKSGGQEKGEQSKSGGQEKGEAGQEKGEQSKTGGQEKGEQSKSGGQEKGEAGQEKGEQSKSGGQEKGEQSKSGGQEKGEAGQEKGEQSKSGGQEKGEAGKESGKEKGEAGKESGKEKSEAGKEAAKQKGEEGKQGGQPGEGGDPKGKGESKEGEQSKSKDEGEEKGKPGGLPDGAPKNGGMREGTEGPGEKPDSSQPSPRSVEPENQTREDLSPQQKADQRLLNRLKQMVEKNEITKDIEQATGLSREEIDQFVRKYEAPTEDRRARQPQESGEIVTGPGGEDRERRVTLPGETPDGKVLSRSGRGSGMVKDDEMRGNLEGARSRVPAALRARVEAYQRALSRTPASGGAPANSGTPATSGGSTGTGSGTNR